MLSEKYHVLTKAHCVTGISFNIIILEFKCGTFILFLPFRFSNSTLECISFFPFCARCPAELICLYFLAIVVGIYSTAFCVCGLFNEALIHSDNGLVMSRDCMIVNNESERM